MNENIIVTKEVIHNIKGCEEMSRYARFGTLSPLGAADSKYFLNPEQFEIDVKEHQENHRKKEEETKRVLTELMNQDTWQEDNFKIITKALRELKEEYKL